MITKFLKSICAVTLILCIGFGFSACESGNDSDPLVEDTSKLVGEWEAISIVTTFNNGEVLSITDKYDIEQELDGLERVTLTQSLLTMLSSGKEYSYTLTNNNLSIPSLGMSLGVMSISQNEIVFKFVAPTYTSIITYKKVENKPINKNNLLGEWKAYKIVATYNSGEFYTITDQNSIRNNLQGLEWVTLGETYLTVMNSERSVPCNINDNMITVTTPEVVFKLEVITLKENEIVLKYSYPGLSYTSLITYNRVK